MTDRIAVLEGNLAETNLVELLETLSLTRQLSTVELTSPLGAHEGTLWVKSRQVLDVSAGDRSGMDAMKYLLGRPGNFTVFRIEGVVDPATRPWMSVQELLEAIESLKTSEPDIVRSAHSSTGLQAAGSFSDLSSVAVPSVPPSEKKTQESPVISEENLKKEVVAPLPKPVVAVVPPLQQPTVKPVAPQVVPMPKRAASVPSVPRSASVSLGPILSIVANKGGVGKTTISVNLAVSLARRGIKVILTDTDPRNDVGNALAAKRDTSRGFFDLLDGSVSLDEVLLQTALPGLSVLPAGGINLSEEVLMQTLSRPDRLGAALSALTLPGGIVIVDTAAGLRGITHQVLTNSTHMLAVVQAEPLAVRSSKLLPKILDGLPANRRPALTGVILNMFDRRVGASLGMLEDACDIFGGDNVFDIPIPRAGVFVEASNRGVPVALMDAAEGPAVGWIFESLATHVLSRLGLATPKLSELQLL